MSDKLILKLDTGDVTIETYPDSAPNHVARIKQLADGGFYDGLKLHRVIDGFMAQMGCPQGTGMGGSEEPNLGAEFNDISHQRGICSMARSQSPDSANSQFFICLDDASFLDTQYTVWGKVVDGMEHVDAAQKGEPPANPTKIVSFKSEA